METVIHHQDLQMNQNGISHAFKWNARVIVTLVIIVFALVSRFAMLGTRTMSHDEVNHVVPSYELSQGRGYSHNPVTHGPFQFHIVALTYFLFGDTDFTSRMPAAIFSVAAILFILFGMKRYLGSTGAMAAAVLFLISPYMLFYGRYTRNEAFIELIGVLLIYSVLRYLEKGDLLSLFLFTISNALHFTIKETAYIYAAETMIFLTILLLDQLTREKWSSLRKRNMFIYLVLAMLMSLGVTLVLAVMNAKSPEAAAVPANASLILTGEIIALGATILLGLTALILVVRSLGWLNIKKLRSFNLLFLLFSLVLPLLSAFPLKILGFNPTDYSSPAIIRSGITIIITFTVAVVLGIWWNRSLWIPQAMVFYAVFVVFYTTFFTNGSGFFTGILGALGYWLEQQGVNRGTQPWYYYAFLQIPFYEYLAVFGTLIAAFFGIKYRKFSQRVGYEPSAIEPVLTSSADSSLSDDSENHDAEYLLSDDGVQEKSDGEEVLICDLKIEEDGVQASEDKELEEDISSSDPQRLPVLAYLIFLGIISLIAFTMAGEKMPWLTVHIALPLLLSAGWGIGYLIDSIPWKEIIPIRLVINLLVMVVMITSFSGVIRSLFGVHTPFSGKSLEQLQATATFILSLIVFAGSTFLLLRFEKQWAWPHAGSLTVLGITACLGVLTARAAYQASFINYEYATEFLVYAHAATGPKEILAQVEEISQRTTGGYDLKIAFDDEARYPYWWYARKYPNRKDFNKEPGRDLLEYPVIITGGNTTKVDSIVRDQYVFYQYKRLWWPIEDYNRIGFSQVWKAVKNPEMRSALFQIWFNRNYEPYAALKKRTNLTLSSWQPSNDMRMYIRKDIAAKIWNYGVSPSVPTQEVSDPYAKSMKDFKLDVVIDGANSPAVSMQGPHGVAFAPDGSLYISDSRNNRILHFSSGGEFMHQWGILSDSEPAEMGTFREPWGIAVASDGSVLVADTWNHRIQRFNADGRFLNGWGYFGQAEKPDGFWGPRDIVIDSQNRVYISDTGNKRIAVFTLEGKFITQFGVGGMELGQMDEPVGLALDSKGNVYVADTWNQRVQVFQPDENGLVFTAVREWPVAGWRGQSLENKPFLSIDSKDQVYVADPEGFRILVFDSQGKFLYGFGQYSPDLDGFGQAGGVEIAPDDSVWVADSFNNRVVKVHSLP